MSPNWRVFHVAMPCTPGCSVVSTCDQSVAPKGMSVIFMASGLDDTTLSRLSRSPVPWCAGSLLRDHRKRKAERHADRELPVGRCVADAAPNGDVQENIRGRRLPDEADQRRIVRPLALGDLAVDLADETKPRSQRKLSDDAPAAEELPAPVETASPIDVHHDRRQLRAHDTDRLESDTAFAVKRRREQRAGLHRDTGPWLVLKHSLFEDCLDKQPRVNDVDVLTHVETKLAD